MILSRRWLEEFVDLKDVALEKIVDALNRVGHEVTSYHRIAMPEGVVVGLVTERIAHPDADKLSVTQVDVGSGKIVQIVCGASNVATGQFVPVALPGTVLPSGLKIGNVKLRGMESGGMICSASELGLPPIGQGILELDASVGTLVLGRPLCELTAMTDEIIEVELTANRGDCLSIAGMAREIGAALERTPIERPLFTDDENNLGIGRLVHLQSGVEVVSSLAYRALAEPPRHLPLLLRLRLALVEISPKSILEGYISYAMHATGVLIRAYGTSSFRRPESDDKIVIAIDRTRGIDQIWAKEGKEKTLLSTVGISQSSESRPTPEETTIFLEASYTDPVALTIAQFEHNMETDELFYRASRGSEVEIEKGLEYLCEIVRAEGVALFGGAVKHIPQQSERLTKLTLSSLEKIIGMKLEKNSVVSILKRLSFGVSLSHDENELIVSIPPFRHDILNEHDLAEEIVRMYGIDNIPAKPLHFIVEKRHGSGWSSWQQERRIRERAVMAGFSEAIHFIFGHRHRYEEFSIPLVMPGLDIANPITAELDTLRSNLTLGLIVSAQGNMKNGYKKVALFEQGAIFGADRSQRRALAFIWSGLAEEASLANHGKPAEIDFSSFMARVASVTGAVQLEPSIPPEAGLFHPFQYARLVRKGEIVGFVARLHPAQERALDLPATFLAQFDADKLVHLDPVARPISRFQKVVRDLTLAVAKESLYRDLRLAVERAGIEELRAFYPIDRYVSPEGVVALTVRFELQSDTKTFEEAEISALMEKAAVALAAVGAEVKQ